MTNARLIELFYQHRSEIITGLWRYNIQLRERKDDVEQDVLLKLLKYNENHHIDEENAKQLFFITWKNMCITELNGNKSKLFTHTPEGDISELEVHMDHFNNSDDTFVDEYREKALELISVDDYHFWLNHLNFIDSGLSVNKKDSSRVNRIKKKLNLSSTYEVIIDGEYIGHFKSLNHIEKTFKMPQGNLSLKIKMNGSEFNYNKQKWVVRKKTNKKL